MAFRGILWQEYTIFKRKFWSITSGSMIAPVLYLIAFGWGLGGGLRIDGKDYINFIILGIVAMTTMTVSYSTIGNAINISRLYEKTFEAFMVAPINMWVYAAGKITAGALRGLYSGFLIILLAFVFQTKIHINAYFILMIIMNCLTFSALGFIAGILIKSHGDMAKFTSFVITPMSFLCGTFFPIEKVPFIFKSFILLLPLTHTSLALRSSGEDFLSMVIHPLVLLFYFVLASGIGIRLCRRAE